MAALHLEVAAAREVEAAAQDRYVSVVYAHSAIITVNIIVMWFTP